ncbi:sigma factor-binding protein Crl [Vibrio sp. JPW-9-11-11]|uniref:sigma factor-binding protein Crl n=1 Tax=Vibrio sp. JPW-9-11-11 TaxID=1416532 RepID=UPI001593132B|nr:sigma factor-binding protein Crl [Vibrio sp. JPW-9-11-11]NVD07337.1 sigma factor-binding protein Crl [Vibrio sp. JPW-9-11-11]
MSEQIKNPTHYRLLSTLRAIGPYLRESQSNEGYYLFDCLSVCVNDKKSPEQREFWGWWLELVASKEGFEARYRSGLYDITGEWQGKALPKKSLADVTRTQEAFHQKLVDTLQKEFEIAVVMHKESVEFV